MPFANLKITILFLYEIWQNQWYVICFWMSQHLPQICIASAEVYHKSIRFAVNFGTLSIHNKNIYIYIRCTHGHTVRSSIFHSHSLSLFLSLIFSSLPLFLLLTTISSIVYIHSIYFANEQYWVSQNLPQICTASA